MRVQFLFIITILISSLTGSLARDTAKTDELIAECDKAAASTYDLTRPKGITGISFDAIVANTAITKCRRAISAVMEGTPHASRLWYNLGRALQKIGQDDKAFVWYEKSAAADHSVAANNAGTILEDGARNIPQNKKAALEYYRTASKAGLSVAHSNLGRFYREGIVVKKDIQKH